MKRFILIVGLSMFANISFCQTQFGYQFDTANKITTYYLLNFNYDELQEIYKKVFNNQINPDYKYRNTSITAHYSKKTIYFDSTTGDKNIQNIDKLKYELKNYFNSGNKYKLLKIQINYQKDNIDKNNQLKRDDGVEKQNSKNNLSDTIDIEENSVYDNFSFWNYTYDTLNFNEDTVTQTTEILLNFYPNSKYYSYLYSNEKQFYSKQSYVFNDIQKLAKKQKLVKHNFQQMGFYTICNYLKNGNCQFETLDKNDKFSRKAIVLLNNEYTWNSFIDLKTNIQYLPSGIKTDTQSLLKQLLYIPLNNNYYNPQYNELKLPKKKLNKKKICIQIVSKTYYSEKPNKDYKIDCSIYSNYKTLLVADSTVQMDSVVYFKMKLNAVFEVKLFDNKIKFFITKIEDNGNYTFFINSLNNDLINQYSSYEWNKDVTFSTSYSIALPFSYYYKLLITD